MTIDARGGGKDWNGLCKEINTTDVMKQQNYKLPFLRKRPMRPSGNCKPALADLPLPAVVFLPTRLPPLPSSDMIKKVSCSLVKEIGLRGWRSASIRERIMCTAITNI